MGNNNWKPFGGSNSAPKKDNDKSQTTTSEVIEENKEEPIAILPSELKELIRQELENAKKSEPAPAQTQPIERVALQIKNENIDDIPQLSNFASKERMYVLVNGVKPISFNLQTRHKQGSPLQYIHPDTKETHALFLSYTETSFFKDKHKSDAKVEQVRFKDGMLKTYESDVKLQKFLEIHPGNVKNGGSIFEEYDPAKEATAKVTDFEIELEAMNLANSLSQLKRDSIASILCSDYLETWTPAELKQAVFVQAKKQPKNFVKLANDPTLEMKGVAKTALRRSLIVYKNYRFYDASGDVIVEVGKNQDHLDALVEYFMSGTGRTTYDYLKNAVA